MPIQTKHRQKHLREGPRLGFFALVGSHCMLGNACAALLANLHVGARESGVKILTRMLCLTVGVLWGPLASPAGYAAAKRPPARNSNDVFSLVESPPVLRMTRDINLVCYGLRGGGIPIKAPRALLTGKTPDYGPLPVSFSFATALPEVQAKMRKEYGCFGGISAFSLTVTAGGNELQRTVPLCLRGNNEAVSYKGNKDEPKLRESGKDIGYFMSQDGLNIPSGIAALCTYSFLSYERILNNWTPTTIIALPKKLTPEAVKAPGNWTVEERSWNIKATID